ncbi:hypothetical protein ACED51_10390 [Photobacterium swingsii]|uniref:hypothetical protein n=1 Tax=Photobacterium swingsii TaxID=680026 RepID=UPI00352D2E5C
MIFNNSFDSASFSEAVENYINKLAELASCTDKRAYKTLNDRLIPFIQQLSTRPLSEVHETLNIVESCLLTPKDINDGGRLKVCNMLMADSFGNEYQVANVTALRLFLVHLARVQLVILDVEFESAPFAGKKGDEFISDLLHFYPKALVPLYFMSSVPRFTAYGHHIPDEIKQKWQEVTGGKKLATDALSQNFRRLAGVVLINGIERFEDISVDMLLSFQKGRFDKGITSEFSITYSLTLVDRLTGGDLKERWLSSKLTVPTTKIAPTEPDKKTFLGTNFKAKGLLDADKLNVKRIQVTIRSADKKKTVDYGYWSGVGGTSTNFNVTNSKAALDPKDPWIASQKDYIKRRQVESNSAKVTSQRLSVLNRYLFDYLPAYFEQGFSRGVMDFPKYPRELNTGLFVERSYVFEAQANLPDEFQYPVTLPQFIMDMTMAGATISSNGNSTRETLGAISRFFDYLTSLDKSFAGIDINPIPSKPIGNIGIKYTKNTKFTFPIKYWMLLRQFSMCVADAIIEQGEKSINDQKSSPRYVDVNKTIRFADEEVFIGRVDLSDIAQSKLFIDGKTKDTQNIYINDYVVWSALAILTYSGLRLANAFWLDIDTCLINVNWEQYDAKVVDIFPLLVNTDKAKKQPFEVYVPRKVIEIIKKTISIRSHFKGECYDGMPYMGSKDSKWGTVKALLTCSDKNIKQYSCFDHGYHEIFPIFEDLMRASNVEFDSTLIYATTLRYSRDEFLFGVANNALDAEVYTVELEYLDDNYKGIRYTPVTRKTMITPHSLRTMLDSVFAPVVGEEAVSDLMTGQTVPMVGHYTKPFEDDETVDFINQVIAITAIHNQRLVTVKESSIDEDKYLSSHEKDPKATALEYNAKSIAFRDITEHEGLQGVERLHCAASDSVAFNRTHICPVGNKCPRTIISTIGEKNCAACPLTVVANNHLPALAATIRRIGDDIGDLNRQLDNDELLPAERAELTEKRDKLVTEGSHWLARIQVAEASSEELYFISKDGKEHLDKIMLNNEFDSASTQFILRMKEVEGVESLQSQNLKIRASRLKRDIRHLSKKEINPTSGKLSEVDEALAAFKLYSDLAGLSIDDMNKLLTAESSSVELLRAS